MQSTYYIFYIDYRVFTLDFPLQQPPWNAGTNLHQTVNQSVYISSTGEHYLEVPDRTLMRCTRVVRVSMSSDYSKYIVIAS